MMLSDLPHALQPRDMQRQANDAALQALDKALGRVGNRPWFGAPRLMPIGQPRQMRRELGGIACRGERAMRPITT